MFGLTQNCGEVLRPSMRSSMLFFYLKTRGYIMVAASSRWKRHVDLRHSQ